MKLHDDAIKALCTGICNYTMSKSTGRAVRGPKGMMEVYQDVVKIDNDKKPMITPFIDHSVNTNEEGKKIPSYGLSSFGYDVRLAPEFKLFTRPNDGRVIDVMAFDEKEFVEEVNADTVVIPPGGLLLGRTIETFNIPNNVLAECGNKSTWARTGMFSLVTPLEPGWSGQLVVEITNCTNFPMRIHANVGICQITFDLGIARPSTTYSDRNGKYQNQSGVQGSIL